MKKIIILLILAAFAFSIDTGCKKNNDDDDDQDTTVLVLNNPYTGTLELYFSNTFPSFAETTTIPVDVDIAGKMTFGTGTLNYTGTNDNGQAKITRDGKLTLAPTGYGFRDGDKTKFAVDENTSLEETYIVWVWNGSSWQMQVNETVTDTWNGGLAFPLDDAVISGAVVATTTSNGTARWTLRLVPVI